MSRRLWIILVLVLIILLIGIALFIYTRRNQEAELQAPLRATLESGRLLNQVGAPAMQPTTATGATLPQPTAAETPTVTVMLPTIGEGEEAPLLTLTPVALPGTPRDPIFLGRARPALFLATNASAVQAGGAIWRGDILLNNGSDVSTALLSLTNATGWLEASCPFPTRSLGVQFLGDGNDGWAKVVIDQQYTWSGNTWGGSSTFDRYVEFNGLSDMVHTIRVEALGQSGGGTDTHVTIVAIGCGPVASWDYMVYLPFVAQG
ncbi:MAG: hypothetical protein R3C14_51560 [Caldilineaceae bacterium]